MSAPASLTFAETKEGITERRFTVSVGGEAVPAVIWCAQNALGHRPLILLGRAASQHKRSRLLATLARRFVEQLGCAALAIDAPGHGDRISREEAERMARQGSDRA